jgi:hypothetical protein
MHNCEGCGLQLRQLFENPSRMVRIWDVVRERASFTLHERFTWIPARAAHRRRAILVLYLIVLPVR